MGEGIQKVEGTICSLNQTLDSPSITNVPLALVYIVFQNYRSQ